MSWEYVHLVIHQFPIVLSIAGVLVGALGWITGREELERYGVLSLLIAGVFGLPSYLTGIAAADVVSERTFVRPSIVQTHRTWATWAAVALTSSGIFAGFSLAQRDDRGLRHLVLVTGAVAALLTGIAALRGGEIEHGEREDQPGETPAEVRSAVGLTALPMAAAIPVAYMVHSKAAAEDTSA